MGTERLDREIRRRLSSAHNVLYSSAKASDVKKRAINLLDTVALLEDLPERKLRAGEVGTVVELLDKNVYEVEFCTDDGETYAEFALRADQIMPLHSRGKPLKAILAS